jgi:hypothetical protein
MARSVLPYIVLAALLGTISGCGVFERPQRPAWREQAEKACLARRKVPVTAYVQMASSIDGPGICGLTQPFKVTALAGGSVTLNSTQTIGCPLTEALDQWVDAVVQPAALARFGQKIAQIDAMGTYSCRAINNTAGGKLSEHAFGNAMDIGGFRLADGRKITVVQGWTRGDEQEQAFLREVHAGACEFFTTVLGPGANALHYNHIHVDLAMHGSTSRGLRRYCRPVIKDIAPPPRKDNLPDPPELEPEIDVSRATPMERNTLALARRPYDAPRPGAQIASNPLSAAALPPSALPPMSPRSISRMGSLDASAPIALPSSRAPSRGSIRDDGAFVPEDELGD